MKLNCVNDVLSWFDDACKNSSYGLVVGDDGKFRTRAYFVSMQFVRGVSTGSLLVGEGEQHRGGRGGIRARIIISLGAGGKRMQQQWWTPHHSMFSSSLHQYEPDTEAKAAAAAQNARLSRRLVKRPHPSLSYFFLLPRRIQPTDSHL